MRKKPQTGFPCAHHGEWHHARRKDLGAQLPDDVWAPDGVEWCQRARHDPDRCTLDHQHPHELVAPCL